MRLEDIRFKAKSLTSGKWVYGIPTENYDHEPCMFVAEPTKENPQWGFVKVDPSTVCQYTGLKDETGNLIYENDIIQDDGAYKYIIEYKNCCFVMIDLYGNYCGLLSDVIDEAVLRKDWILLGSKFDKEGNL